MSTSNASDQAQKPPPEPMEDPTGHGSLEQLAKKGVGGAQVLAEKLTGSDTDRYLVLLHAYSHSDSSLSASRGMAVQQHMLLAGLAPNLSSQQAPHQPSMSFGALLRCILASRLMLPFTDIVHVLLPILHAVHQSIT